MVSSLDDGVLREIYAWVDEFPLSRPKRNISRDFSDGVLLAEIIYQFFPKYVDLHNFSNCNTMKMKRNNWFLLNRKVFPKLKFNLTDDVIEALISAKSGTIEKLLLLLRDRIAEHEKNNEQERTHSTGLLPQLHGTKPLCTLSSYMAPMNSENARNSSRLNFLKTSSRFIKQDTKSSYPGASDSNAREFQKTRCVNLGRMTTSSLQAFEQKAKECIFLQEKVDILNAKLRRMMHLLDLKDMRIKELQSSLEKLLKS